MSSVSPYAGAPQGDRSQHAGGILAAKTAPACKQTQNNVTNLRTRGYPWRSKTTIKTVEKDSMAPPCTLEQIVISLGPRAALDSNLLEEIYAVTTRCSIC